MRSTPRRAAAAAAAFALACVSTARAATPVAVNVDCTSGSLKPWTPFWNSCGYTPAEYALRADEAENMAWVGSTPNRAIEQVRIHFLLDLLVVTGFEASPSQPSGYALTYDWVLLDSAIDWLVSNRLSPGFELMGSPIGFPQLPASSYQPSNGNGAVQPAQTLAMMRAMSRDIILHYTGRYGVQEVSQWNFESWNEPACGWNWPTGANVTAAVLQGYANLWDALAAGIEDAETALGGGVRFKYGGPAACQGVKSVYMQWAVQHYANGSNVYTGAPARLDFISSHFKGGGSAAGTVNGAYTLFDWLRKTYPDNPRGLWSVPFYNDEADPLVGWAVPTDWRGDGRYPAMQAKEVNQHLIDATDLPTSVSNPVGLISFDAGMMNEDGYTGYGQRTLLARFNGGDGSGLPGTPFAFVRKQGLLFNSLMSKLSGIPFGDPYSPATGTLRCSISGTGFANASNVLNVSFGGIATVTPASSSSATTAAAGGPGTRAAGLRGTTTPTTATTASASASVSSPQASVMLYNSRDTSNATGPDDDLTVSLTLTGLPFAAGSAVLGLHWRLDDAVSPEAVWTAQGSPVTPSPAQLQAMWDAGRLQLLGSVNLTVGPGGSVVVPAFDLPLPALTLWHFVAAAPAAAGEEGETREGSGMAMPALSTAVSSSLPAPTNVRAYVKDPSLSLLDPASQREVLVRWDCAGPRNGTGPGAGAAASFTLTYLVNASTAGPTGPWTTVSGQAYPDFSCAAVHAAPTTDSSSLWYTIAGVDYWGGVSAWSSPIQVQAWPAAPADGLRAYRERAAEGQPL